MKWEQHFEALVAFKRSHGHCNVPRTYKENGKLGRWVDKQRSLFRNFVCNGTDSIMNDRSASIKKERLEKLLSIGFQFRLRTKNRSQSQSWEERYNQLLHFCTAYGHTRVPLNWQGNTALSHWVVIQRKEHKKLLNGEKSFILTEPRLQKLLDVDFVFRDQQTFPYSWEERFNHLVAFEKRHGHFNVTPQYKLDQSLYIWVNTVRSSIQNDTIELDRLHTLLEIGFD